MRDPWIRGALRRARRFSSNSLCARTIPTAPLTIFLACVVGLLSGYGAVLFAWLTSTVTDLSVAPVLALMQNSPAWRFALLATPAVGLLAVSWFTRRFAPEAQGHGVPEYAQEGPPLPPLFGVGYGVVDHALHLESEDKPSSPIAFVGLLLRNDAMRRCREAMLQ